MTKPLSEGSASSTETAGPGGAEEDRELRRFLDALERREAEVENCGTAAVGTRACLTALRRRQVDVLFLEHGYEPLDGWACDACGTIREAEGPPRRCVKCGSRGVRAAKLLEELERLARETGARVDRVAARALPATAGGVGCLLLVHEPVPSARIDLGHYTVVALTLFAFWVLLSGHYTVLLLSLGAASVLLVVWLCLRMDRVDAQISWSRPSFGLAGYLAWLLWMAIKSSADVARRVWDPGLPVSPSWTRVDTGIRAPLKKTLYANSITLTPGTLTTSAHEEHLMVHSLADSNLEELREGAMERRIDRLEL